MYIGDRLELHARCACGFRRRVEISIYSAQEPKRNACSVFQHVDVWRMSTAHRDRLSLWRARPEMVWHTGVAHYTHTLMAALPWWRIAWPWARFLGALHV